MEFAVLKEQNKGSDEQIRNLLLEKESLTHIIETRCWDIQIDGGCMVDLFGRAGLLKDAVILIKNMPIEPTEIVWSSLLAACRIHKNVELAVYADKLTETNKHRAGTQVLLSNIYASAGKWTSVAEVRLRLKENGHRKTPGMSWIEIDGEVHEFVSGDELYRNMTDVELMLDEKKDRLAAAECFLHDTSNAFLDVDEKENELLVFHTYLEKESVTLLIFHTYLERLVILVEQCLNNKLL